MTHTKEPPEFPGRFKPEITSDFEITETHGGHKEDCTGYAFRYAYIDQRAGYLDDDFSGEIWIPLPKGKFLKFHFAM